MSWKPEGEAAGGFLIQKTAKALPAPEPEKKKSRRSILRVAADIWHVIKGYTAEDIGRLKEGGIQQVEGKGQTAIAEAKAKVAEAAERHAKAEHERAEAIKARAEAYATIKKADGEFAKDKAEAFNAVVQAISTIKQAGGNVVFDLDQIQKLISQGKKEFPKDKLLQGVEIEDEELEERKE